MKPQDFAQQEVFTQRVSFEVTPNPATLKFHLYCTVTDAPFECKNVNEAERSPLALKLFGFPWTASVFLGQDFVTITKHDWVDWAHLAEPLRSLIEEHRNNDEGFELSAQDRKKISSPNDVSENDSEIVKQIKNILNREIRPALAYDGGDIEFIEYTQNVLHLKLKGSCSGCPSSRSTLKDGIEVRLKQQFPEILEVRGS